MPNNCEGIICYCTPCQCTDDPELEAAYETISKLRTETSRLSGIITELEEEIEGLLAEQNNFKQALKHAFTGSDLRLNDLWMTLYGHLLKENYE